MSKNPESRLDAVLRALAGEMRTLEAPPLVERALRREFRAQRNRRRLLAWSAAFSAAAAVAAFVVILAPKTPDQQVVATTQPVVEAVTETPRVVASVTTAPRAKPASKTQQVRRSRAGRTQAAPREIVTSFIPTEFWDYRAPLERGHLVRVRVPRATLANYGLPYNPERADEQITADLLLGEDGVARAIRFVQNR